MAGESTSPNMNMPVPGIGVTVGPQYAIDLNACLAILDGHDHSAGSGTKITPAGLNISSDLNFLGNNATTLRSTRFSSQAVVLNLAADLNCLSVVLGDLYFNDGTGNRVRITQAGGVAGSPGSISNLTNPASAAYVAASSTFVWQSAASTAAKMDNGAIKIRSQVASSKYVELAPPSSLPADYSISLPNLPIAQQIMTLDATGNMSAPYTVDGTGLKIISNVLSVDGASVTNINGANIQTGSINAATALTAQSVTQDRLALRPSGAAAGNVAYGTPVNITNGTSSLVVVASVTLQTTGRPVRVFACSGSGANSYMQINGAGSAQLFIYNTSTPIASTLFTSSNPSTAVNYGASSLIEAIDVPAVGSYTWTLQNINGSVNNVFVNVRLIAYEL